MHTSSGVHHRRIRISPELGHHLRLIPRSQLSWSMLTFCRSGCTHLNWAHVLDVRRINANKTSGATRHGNGPALIESMFRCPPTVRESDTINAPGGS